MKIKSSLFYLLSFFLSHSLLVGQSKTNFELIDSLLMNSVEVIAKSLKKEKVYKLNFIGSIDYTILESRIKKHFQEAGINLGENEESKHELNYNLYEAKTAYNEVFQDGIFGDYLVKREAKILLSLNKIDESKKVINKDYQYSVTDTIAYGDLSNLENIAYTFSSAEIPEEPLFSSSLEPIIAVGTAAIAVYLFFNIRSK